MAFEAQPVYDALDKQNSYQLKLPTGDEDVFVVRGGRLPKKWNPHKDVFGNLDHNQALLAAQLISRQVGTIYDVAGFQTLEEQFYKGGEVKDYALVRAWAHARQRGLRVPLPKVDDDAAQEFVRLTMDYPVARDIGGTVRVFGVPSGPKPDEGGVAETFGLTLHPDTYDWGIAFEENNGVGETSIRANRHAVERRLGAGAHRPSYWDSSCLVLEKRQVAHQATEDLHRLARLGMQYESLKPAVDAFAAALKIR